jgi:hypothetical protein
VQERKNRAHQNNKVHWHEGAHKRHNQHHRYPGNRLHVAQSGIDQAKGDKRQKKLQKRCDIHLIFAVYGQKYLFCNQ